MLRFRRCSFRCVSLLALATLFAGAASGQTSFSYNFDDYANGSTPPNMQLVGNAVITDDLGGGFTDQRLRLTFSGAGQQGAGWRNTLSNVSQSFNTTFTFQISFLGGGGADGFSFNVQNLGSGINTGEEGPGAGSLTVKFDTWNNGGSEPSDNFIRVLYAGNTAATVDLNTLGIDLSSGATHSAQIVYAPGDLDVFVNGTPVLTNANVHVFGAAPTSANANVSGTGSAYVGFGGRTGGATENHDIKTWSFSGTQYAPTAASNGPYAYSASQLSHTLNSSGSTDAEGALAGYSWQVTGGGTFSGASPTLNIAQAGLTTTTSTNTVTLTVTDSDGATANSSSSFSYTNTAPAASTPSLTINPNYSVSFFDVFTDLDLAGNGFTSSFETLTFEFDLTQATLPGQVGDGFLTGATNPTETVQGSLAGTLSLSQLVSLFGGLGTFTAWANVRDAAGLVASRSFTVTVVPEPGSLLIWGGLAAMAFGLRRRHARRG